MAEHLDEGVPSFVGAQAPAHVLELGERLCPAGDPRLVVAPLGLPHQGRALVGEHQPRDPVGAEEIDVGPHHGHAHRVAEERHIVEVEVDEHLAEVGGEPVEPVPTGGLARSSVAAVVDADHLEVRGELLGDGEELLGGLGPARQADHRRACAGRPARNVDGGRNANRDLPHAEKLGGLPDSRERDRQPLFVAVLDGHQVASTPWR